MDVKLTNKHNLIHITNGEHTYEIYLHPDGALDITSLDSYIRAQRIFEDKLRIVRGHD